MKQILKQIVNDINQDGDFDIDNVDWDALKEAVKEEGCNKSSPYEDIHITVIDLFETVGYEEFGIKDKEYSIN
jgi:hypothetical protein